jgi:hypothetical protein
MNPAVKSAKLDSRPPLVCNINLQHAPSASSAAASTLGCFEAHCRRRAIIKPSCSSSGSLFEVQPPSATEQKNAHGVWLRSDERTAAATSTLAWILFSNNSGAGIKPTQAEMIVRAQKKVKHACAGGKVCHVEIDALN